MTSGGLAAVSSSAFAALYSAFGKYDVVHIHAEGPAFFAWLPKMFGKRVVVTVHGIDWQREKWQSGLGSKFIHQGEKNAAKLKMREDAYAESVKYFREENDGKLPSLKSLKKRKEELTQEIAERKKAYAPLREESRRLEIASDNVYGIFRKTNEMKSNLARKREWEAKVREKARQEQARQEQRERQPKRKKRSYDMSL